MLTDAKIDAALARAGCAPALLPADWRRAGLDLALPLDALAQSGAGPVDPEGRLRPLVLGMAAEALRLALSALGAGVEIGAAPTGGGPLRLRIAGRAAADPLHSQLEQPALWAGRFDPAPPRLFGWGRRDAILLTDAPARAEIARHEKQVLTRWTARRAGRETLARLGRATAAPGLAVTPFERRCAVALPFGAGARRLVRAQGANSAAAPVIALLHRPAEGDALADGAALLRLWLEATRLGLMGWPLAVTLDPEARAALAGQHPIGPDRRLVAAVRFGIPLGAQNRGDRNDG